MNGRKWYSEDEKKLIENYPHMTIHELMLLFPKRTQLSINNKIKNLKAEGKIVEDKLEGVNKRSYCQRNKDILEIVEQHR